MSKSRDRTIRDHGEDEKRNDTADERTEGDPWPRAAWSRAVASNA